MAKHYTSPDAFRQAIEVRLRELAKTRGMSVNDVRLRLVMERLLARLFAKPEAPWLLKGGYAMDLRYRPKARTTRDVDLSVGAVTEASLNARLSAIREQLQDAAETDTGDFLEFRIGVAKGDLPGAPKGGGRFPVEALLAGKTYAKFHLDLGFGDAVVGRADELVGEDFLGFAGIPPGHALAIPKPQQFAEKVHAYTYPWTDRVNTRTKDLVDLVLLIERGRLEPGKVTAAVNATFTTRGTHPKPESLPVPPESWRSEFPAMSAQAGLSTDDMSAAFAILSAYWTNHQLGA